MGKYYLPRMCSYWEPWYFLVKSMTAWMKFFSDLFSIWRSNKNVLSQLCLTNSFCGQGKRSLLRLWRVRRYLIVVVYEVISFNTVLNHNSWHVMQATKKFHSQVNSHITGYGLKSQLCVILSSFFAHNWRQFASKIGFWNLFVH